MQDYHKLDIWQRSMEYTVQVYAYTAQLPPEEGYGLAAQVRKAAISVPLNVAEGTGCATRREFCQFLGYAYRSLKEVVTGLELCQRLYSAIRAQPVTELIDEGNQISRMTRRFMQRLGDSGLHTHNSRLITQD
jgi:four helix bundle protein